MTDAFRNETEARLKRIVRIGEVFIDGDAFDQILVDPSLVGCDDYRVHHDNFIAVKRTLLKLKRVEEGDIGITTWRRYEDKLVVTVPVDNALDRYVCPGVHEIRPSQAAALEGQVGVEERAVNGVPYIFVCAPIRNSLDEIVGVLEAFASLDLSKGKASLFNY